MKWISHVPVVIVLPLMLFGCAPIFGKYYYFSLESGKDVVVLERSKSEASNLFFHDEMPTKYQVVRNEYTLLIDVDKKSYLPAISMNALGNDGSIHSLTEKKSQRHPKSNECVSFDQFTKKTENHVKFFWYSCNQDEAPETVTIYVDVFDQDKIVIGSEELKFNLVPNGIYYIIDAL